MSQQGRPYVCTGCGAGSKAPVKLWREYQTFADHTELLCAACCTKRRSGDPREYGAIGPDGKCAYFFITRVPRRTRRAMGRMFGRPGRSWPATTAKYHGMSDQVADWMVPAVPTEDGTFWGYTSVPANACAWWDALPLAESPDVIPSHEDTVAVREAFFLPRPAGDPQDAEATNAP